MPRRGPEDSQPLWGDEDSEPEDTPRAKRPAPKKRVSEVFRPGEGAEDPKTNFNDDKAEKRRRRKSNKIHVIDNAEPGLSADTDPAPRAAPARAQQKPLAAIADEVPVNINPSNFEEWMKMATDNKINAANSWNFALIDYFKDMSLLRNVDDNTINFQRASCTLDGCVKIWTSRVDSVGTETGKLLSNLAADSRSDDEDDDGENGGGNGSDNPDGGDKEKRRKKHHAGDTLAKPGTLQVKKLEVEFMIDPLFKKTSADFDEGGAGGLLMNHLSLGMGGEGSMRVVFDASDKGNKAAVGHNADEPEEDVDISFLLKNCLPDLPITEILEDRAISHSLSDFSFSKDASAYDDNSFFQDSTRDDDEDNVNENEDQPMQYEMAGAGDMGFDDYGGNQDQDQDQDDYQNNNDGIGGGGDYGSPGYGNGDARQGGGGNGPLQPFDPQKKPSPRDLVMAIGDDGGIDGGALGQFDNQFLNYGGPTHFKLKKAIRRQDPAEKAAPKKKPEKREAVKIDFSAPTVKTIKEIATELFAPPAKGKAATINLTGTTGRGKRKREEKPNHLLPDDLHFTSKNLVTLFLKPKFQLKMRGQQAQIDEATGEVQPDFWAAAAANDDSGNDDVGHMDTNNFGDDYLGPVFEDDEAPGFSTGTTVVDSEEQDLLAMTEGMTRKVKPEFVKYAKRAKRVDVRKLKESIWRGLDINVPQKKEEDMEDEAMDLDEPIEESEPRVFRQVISGLQSSYPKEKMDDISTSFCFICLLHLANEQGLKLESFKGVPMDDEEMVVDDEEEEDEEVRMAERKVGNIWELKVSRDPNATAGS